MKAAPLMEGEMICVRFTAEQVKWLREKAAGLDRPVSWLVRSFVIAEMKAAAESASLRKKRS